MSAKRSSTSAAADPPRKRPCHFQRNTVETHCTVSPVKNPPVQAQHECSGDDIPPPLSSHAKDVDHAEDIATYKNNNTLRTHASRDLVKIAPKTNIETWIGRVKGTAYPSDNIPAKTVCDAAVQTESSTFPVDISSVPYQKLSIRFAKVKSRCNDLYVSLDHAKLASEAGWSKYWGADAECRELRKLVRESNDELVEARESMRKSNKELVEIGRSQRIHEEELVEARKLIGKFNKELAEARKLIGKSNEELTETREELDDVICAKESAYSDARFWRRKWADLGGITDVAELHDDYT
ncbi:hypothetical protein K435DRAFT_852385 [Dendrothele bispora CBS 962.96]|uniref:Uncharacterized protein n=1 Tax=Dendrothele bispora (strain CBS 962.96) TaxID=1314807 RepID=A0A4S8MKF3_DENBC|nr:hypothetical protein K435DRAFT_852385 [Dendrothele bispora CBS 962.96]